MAINLTNIRRIVMIRNFQMKTLVDLVSLSEWNGQLHILVLITSRFLIGIEKVYGKSNIIINIRNSHNMSNQCSKRREAWRGGTTTPQALRAFAKPWHFVRRA